MFYFTSIFHKGNSSVLQSKYHDVPVGTMAVFVRKSTIKKTHGPDINITFTYKALFLELKNRLQF